MSKYLAAVINSLNHDRSISASLSPTEKIQKLVQKHQNGGYEYFQKLV
jgi:ribose-phosphate pyrophosphokinase